MPITPDENQQPDLAKTVKKMGEDLHTMKGNQAAQATLIKDLSDKLEQNTTITADNSGKLDSFSQWFADNRADMTELVEFARTAKGGIKFTTWAGNAVKWGAGIAAAVIGLWIALKGGPHP